MSYEDEKIVKLSFDNEAFKKGVSETLVALRNLEKALDVDPKQSSKSFDNLSESINTTEESMTKLEKSAEKVKVGFSALQVAGITVFASLTTAAIRFGRSLYSNTIGQITEGGFNRALNLENAKFQIEGLKKSWTELKEDILYGVKDTAYGLDDAAKIAAQLTASGIKSATAMKTSLRAISGVAAMTNSSYAEIGDVFATAAANGRMMGEELRRLSERGLNVAANMAEYYKKMGKSALDTEQKVRDMAAKGKISFQEFANAMDACFGEHAKEANKTFTGAMSNMRAALSRLGEAFQSPMLELRRRLAVSVIPAIDNLTDKLSKYAVPVFKRILDFIGDWAEKLSHNYDFLRLIYNVVMGVYSWIHETIRALWQLGLISPNLFSIVRSLADMTDWMVLNGERAEKFRNIIKFLAKGFDTLLLAVKAVIWALEPIYKPVLSFLESIFGLTGDIAGGTMDIFDHIQRVIKVIAVIIHFGIDKAVRVIVKTVQILIGVLKVLRVILSVIALAIGGIIVVLFNLAKKGFTYIKSLVDSIDWLKKAFLTLYDAITFVFKNAGNIVSAFIDGITSSTGSLWDSLSNLFKAKTVKTTVVVDDRSLKSAVDTMSTYNSAAAEAQKAGEKANDASLKVSASGGTMQGYFGVSGVKDIIAGKIDSPISRDDGDETKDAANNIKNALDKVGQATEEADKKIDKSLIFGSSDFSSGFISEVYAITQAVNDLGDVNPVLKVFLSTILIGGATFVFGLKFIIGEILEVLGLALSTIPVVTEAIFEGITSVISTLFKSISKMLSALLSDISEHPIKSVWAIIKIIQAIVLVGALASKIGDPSTFKYLTAYLIGFTGVLVATAFISQVVDPEQFKKVAKIVVLFGGILALITALISIFTFISLIVPLIQKLLSVARLSVVTKVAALSQMLSGIAILAGVVFGFTMMITIYAEKFNNGDLSKIKEVGWTLVGFLAAILTMAVIFAKVLGDQSYIKTSRTLSLKAKSFKNNMSVGMYGVIALISAMSGLIVSLGIVVFALSFRDVDNVTSTLTAIGASILLMSLGISAFLTVMTFALRGMSPKKIKTIVSSLNSMMLLMSLFMKSIKDILVVMALTAFILSGIDTSKMPGVMYTLTLISISVIGFLTIASVCLVSLSKIKFTKTSISFAKMSAFLMEFVVGISSMILVLAIATRILASANPDSIIMAGGVLTLLTIAVSAIFLSLMLAIQKLNSLKIDKTQIATTAVYLQNMAGMLGILMGALVTIVASIAILAKVIDSVKTSSIVWSVSIMAGIFVALGIFYVVINKTASLMPSLQTVYGLVILSGAMTMLLLGIAAFMKVMSTINIDTKLIIVTVGAIATAILSMVLLSKFISGGALVAIAAGWKGLVVIAAFVAGMAGIIALIGKAIGYVGENISLLAKSLNDLSNVKWDNLSTTTSAMKTCIKDLVDVLAQTLNIKNIAGILVLSAGLYMLSNAVKSLSSLKPEQLTAFAVAIKMVVEAFNENVSGIAVAAVIAAFFVQIGWSLAIGMVGFIIFAALVPVLCKAIESAITAVSKVTEIQINLEKTFEYFRSMLPLAAILLIVGGLLSAGGVGLAIGGAALYVGAFAISEACKFIETDINKIEMIEAYVGGLSEVGLLSVAAGFLLSSGAGMLAIGSILLIAAVGIMKGVYKIIKSDFKKLDMAIAYVGGLILLGLVSAVAGLALIIGAGMLSIGSVLFLTSSGLFAISLLILNKAFETIDFNNILNSMDNVVRLCNMLGEIGVILWLTMPTFIIGTALLGLAMLGFAVAGAEIAIGALGIMVGIWALYKAFEMVDMDYINENTYKLIEFGETIGKIGEAMKDGIEPFTVAAVLFAIAAVAIGSGIVTAAVSILIASAAFYATMYVLDGAFDQMLLTFSKVSLMDIFGVVAVLGVLGVGVLVTGLLLSIGAIPFLIGSVVLLLASASMYEAMDKLSKALDMKKVLRIIGALAILSVSFMILAVISPILLVGGLMFIMFGEKASIKLKNAGDNMHEFSEQASEDGKNALYGFIEGISDKTGLTDLTNAVSVIPETVLGTIEDVLDMHSPSRETFDEALNAVAGFVNGLSDGTGDKIANAVRPWGYKVCDVIDGFQNPIESISKACGITGGNGIIDGIFSSTLGGGQLDSLMNMIADSYGGSLSSIFGMGNQAMIDEARKMEAYYKGLADEAGQKGLFDLAATYKQQESSFKAQADELEKQKSIFDIDVPSFEMPNYTPTPPVDPGTADALKDAGEGGTGTSNLAKSAGGNAKTAVTNNTYNFVQNNYSPEPIDRTELYTQTQNQLDSWYKFVRDNG